MHQTVANIGPGGAGAGTGGGGGGAGEGGGAMAEMRERQRERERERERDSRDADMDGGDSEDAANAVQSGEDGDGDGDDIDALLHNGKRKRPMSVSCELCKQRKVKCDRGQPSCGWCTRNGHPCEYRERKKPGLRAGYGRELEQRLDRLEEIIRSHSEILHSSYLHPSSSSSSAGLRGGAPAGLGGIGGLGGAHSHGGGSVHGGSTGSNQGTPMRSAADGISMQSPQRPPPSEHTPIFAAKQPAGPGYGPSPTQSHPPGIDFGGGGGGGLHHHPHQQQSGPAMLPQLPSIHASLAGAKFYEQNQQQQQQQQQQPSIHSSPGMPLPHTPHHPLPPDQDLPPYDLLYALVDLYFKHIYSWCPILHKKRTLDALFMSANLDDADKILLHAIVATTLRYSTDTRLTPERRKHYHDVSKQRVLLYGMENSNVKALQALVILALDLLGSSNGPPGWNIMALITRSVVQLGLAVESTSLSVSPNVPSIYTLRAMLLTEPQDFEEEESRRRLFWTVYLLDRYATIATAFEFALDDREIDRTLPCRDDLWWGNHKVDTRHFRTHESPNGTPASFGPDKPENLGAFSYYIEVLGILSKIHNFLKEPVNITAHPDVMRWQARYKELDDMLSHWRTSLPREYGDADKLFRSGGGSGGSKPLTCGWLMLHATIHTAVIRLHSSAAYPTTRSHFFMPSFSASQRCQDAVENIARIGEFVVHNDMLVRLGPPFAFTLWVAARLLLVHGSTVEHKLSPLIQFFVSTLRDMSAYWPVAARYCELLERVLDEHRACEQKGDGFMANTVKILADMRRTAFDLDVLISRQPRQAAVGVGNGVGIGGGGLTQGRFPSVTPARTPAPNELEYLDVFDFFNVPRLPINSENMIGGGGYPGAMGGDHLAGPGGATGGHMGMGGAAAAAAVAAASTPGSMHPVNEFNITNFAVDASSDWLFKEEEPGSAKFLSSHTPV